MGSDAHATALSGFARVLDVLAALLGTGVLVVLLGGGALTTRAENIVIALATVVGLRALLRPYALSDVRAGRAVATGVVTYVALLGFVVITRHVALRTHAFDLGYYVQVTWNIATGRGPALTIVPTYVVGDSMNAWGDHFSPVLYLLAPSQWLAPGAVPLLVAQTAILAAGAVAVFFYARHRLEAASPAAAVALLYLMNPSLHGINLRDVHPQAFAIPLLVAAALAFETRRYGWCTVALLLTLASREDAAVAVVGFGIWVALTSTASGSRASACALGAAIAAAAVVVLAIDIHHVMARFHAGPYDHLNRYRHLGGSLSEILLTLALPWRWVGVLAATGKIVYVLALLAPLGFLPLAAPRALAAATPGLAMNLLSLDPILFHHRSQYQSFVLPFLILAAVEGFRALRSRAIERRIGWPSPVKLLAAAFVLSTVLTARTVNDLAVTAWRLGPDQRAAYALLGQIPPAVPVSASERVVPHLATRSEVYVFPRGVPRSEYVLVRAGAEPRAAPEVHAVLEQRYELLAREGDWRLLRRR